MRARLGIECLPVRELNLHRATDAQIYAAACAANTIVMTKDADFVELSETHGPPPQVVLVTCGNTSNARLQRLVQAEWPAVLTMLERGEALVELGDRFDAVP